MRIVVTGARGLLGTPTAEYCRVQGADVMSVDVTGRPGAGEYTQFLNADLTEPGAVYDVLDGAEAVIHLAAIPAQRLFPSAITFFTNLRMAWNILEAAARLGIRRVVLASSLQVNHTITPRTPIRYAYFPLDEDHPVSPQDDYGLSKYLGEICANTFARHWGLSVVSFRFPLIASEQVFASLLTPDPEAPFGALYAYLHLRDAARACYLAATADLPPNSHTVLFAAARDSYLDMPTLEYVGRYYPEAEIRPGLEGYASLLNSTRAKDLLGLEPEYALRADYR